MAIAFIIFWALVALIVFFVAMRGGPRGARQSLHTESRTSRRAVAVLVLVLTVAGIAVPTLVLAFNGEHKASVAPGGLKLNATQQHGRELFSQTCATCHTLAAAKAVGRVGPTSMCCDRPRSWCSTRSPTAGPAVRARCPRCSIRDVTRRRWPASSPPSPGTERRCAFSAGPGPNPRFV